jgi:maltooligosyltrehalose trehalohydrolase
MKGPVMERPDYRFGATLVAPDTTRFRFWAPGASSVSVVIGDVESAIMSQLENGWFVTELRCGAGTRYRFEVHPGVIVPDPASRLQAGDPHDESVVVDHDTYNWRQSGWLGRPWHEAVIYELHVGLLGGFSGVMKHLPDLAALGITAIELMPIADFPGPRNWGYDGVLIYAPDASYGTLDELKALVDTAHGLGIMVFLDVVYNHFGPDGNYLGLYADSFYRSDQTTPWGAAIDFRSAYVCRFFIENALYWLTEYRIDGLRFDAVHAIRDRNFLIELVTEIRAAASGRHIHLILENEEQDASLLKCAPEQALYDAQWADDLHHCVHVLLTGETAGYYQDYADAPAERLAHCLARGFDGQGEPSAYRDGAPRGTPSKHLPPTCFAISLQNHDQVGNRAFGERLTSLAHPDGVRAATVLILLAPQIPMLFMGQEWGATAPFLFFTSFTGELAKTVKEGRRREFSHFPAFADPSIRELIPDPNDPATFAASIPDHTEMSLPQHKSWLELHHRLLAIRTLEIVPRLPGAAAISAFALGGTGVLARWRLGDGAELAIAVNLGDVDVPFNPPDGRVLFEVGWTPGQATLRARSAVAVLRS